jgi:uncharacterized oligopeptide transporter (OPT) family protein
MLAGAIVGWAILSPIAKSHGWAPGDVGDWEHGSRGWMVWVSLAALLADCLIKLAWLVTKPLIASSTIRSYSKACRDRLRQKCAGHKYSQLSSHDIGENGQENSLGDTDQEDAANSVSIVETRSNPRETQHEPEASGEGLGFLRLCVILLMSVVTCIISVKYVFGNIIATSTIVVAIMLSLPLSIMGLRAVAETDWNPMSGIGENLPFLQQYLPFKT